jgi:hypothetical protein
MIKSEITKYNDYKDIALSLLLFELIKKFLHAFD